MATSAMLEVSNEDNEVELSLELSIGRGYKRAKPENSRSTSLCVKDRAGVAEKMFGGETGVDFHSKREIQALRRQEAKKKREEKMKKTTNCVTMEARVRDVDEDVRNRKREKIENVVVGNRIGGIGDLNLALKTGSCAIDPSMQLRNCGMLYNSDQVKRCWPHVAGEVKQAEVKVSIPADSRLYQRNFVLNEDGTDHGSAGCSSSAVSDYQSSPGQQGPAGCGSSSNSSHTAKPKQNLNTNSPTQYSEHATASSSSAPKIKSNEPVCRSVSVSVPIPNHPKDNTIEAGKAQIENAKEIVSLPQMPCVSATGNGPNGKTINGLLYRYTKTEVTIVCVCHGTSFSPAGFVEHAGGIDIAHPLKHITVVPSGL